MCAVLTVSMASYLNSEHPFSYKDSVIADVPPRFSSKFDDILSVSALIVAVKSQAADCEWDAKQCSHRHNGSDDYYGCHTVTVFLIKFTGGDHVIFCMP